MSEDQTTDMESVARMKQWVEPRARRTLLTVSEVARAKGIEAATVRFAIRTGRVPAYRSEDGVWLIPERVAQKWQPRTYTRSGEKEKEGGTQ